MLLEYTPNPRSLIPYLMLIRHFLFYEKVWWVKRICLYLKILPRTKTTGRAQLHKRWVNYVLRIEFNKDGNEYRTTCHRKLWKFTPARAKRVKVVNRNYPFVINKATVVAWLMVVSLYVCSELRKFGDDKHIHLFQEFVLMHAAFRSRRIKSEGSTGWPPNQDRFLDEGYHRLDRKCKYCSIPDRGKQ